MFPTIGQVECLEEMGSGRLCAATYECAEESGDLWSDLANHDSRIAIGADSPVARARECSITVDGKAAVRWFTGVSPDGTEGALVGVTRTCRRCRNSAPGPDGTEGALVGVTARHDAELPIVRRIVAGGSEGSGSFLSWYVERYNVGDMVAEVREAACGHLVEGTYQREGCLEHTFPEHMAHVVRHVTWENTPFTRCAAEFLNDVNAPYEPDLGLLQPLTTLNGACYVRISDRSPQIVNRSLCVVMSTIAVHPTTNRYEEDFPGRYAECRTLLEEQWETEGFGELP